jgi:hypothetical protein
MLSRSAIVLVSLLVPAVAAADGARLVSGGPKARAARDTALSAVASARGDMAPCWRGSPPAEVFIALAVGPAGEVTASSPKTPGLAVAAMPATGQRWTAVVAIPSSSSGAPSRSSGGRPAASLQAEIQRQLAGHQATLAACQSVDPNSSGDLSLTLAISPTGIIMPTVASTSVSKAIEACVIGSLRRIALALSDRRAVRYQLSLSFAGEGGGAPRPAAATASRPDGAGPGLKVGSALAADQVDRVITAQKVELVRCGKAASGEVVVGFTIRGDGTTKNVAVKSSTVADPAVAACLVKRVESLRFPTASGESRVTWPFQFRS